ncbi:nucleotide-sugar transporter family protein [Arabidopsis lyrata subsp. lyrata]|uniref:Nucleotide-sugar transporter family protein n=1 Tax=Arabidopsis lyrata subsp. lyrata TaxID=81972 RepID=D7KH08_ARALL|nr:nucleotide-sugar transporter family protein [Arabidopsis lyrata subsp. lyrata]
MTAVKLEAIVCHEPDESELSHFSGNGSKNVVFQLLDQKSSERRWLSERNIALNFLDSSSRFLRWRRRYLPVDGDNRRDHGSVKQSGPLVSGAAYCVSSCSMIILNKIVLSSYNFNAGISLMLYQNLISCLVVAVLDISGVVSVEKFNWKLIRVWMPVNVIFVGMLVSGMYSLKYINVAMVTILKNATNIITAIGEVYMFRKRQNNKVWAAMQSLSDIKVTPTKSLQYRSFLQSAELTLRRVMDKAKQSTKSGSLNEVSMGCDKRCNVLGSGNSKRLPWSSHQLHFDVVPASNRTDNIQFGGIIKQGSDITSWSCTLQRPSESPKFVQHTFRFICWSGLCQSKNVVKRIFQADSVIEV